MRANAIIRFFVDRFVLATGLFLALVLFGFLGATRLGVDLLPPFQLPVVAVTTLYPGAGPQAVSEQLTRPIEEALNTLSGVNQIASISGQGYSQVIVQFNYGVNPSQAAVDVAQKVASIQGSLPSGAKPPSVQKFDVNASPILYVALSSSGQSLTQLGLYARNVLKPEFQRIPGVSEVQVLGAPTPEVKVDLHPSQLAQLGLSPQQVVGAISASALSLPSGTLDLSGQQLAYSVGVLPSAAEQVASFMVGSLPLADIATVEQGSQKLQSYTRLNGQPVVLLGILKTQDSNAVQVSQEIHQAIRTLFLPPGDHAEIIGDTTSFIRSTVSDTLREALLTALVVSFIVLIFLGKLNSVFSVLLAIPISLSGALVLFALFGFTLNIISLLALIVAVGIVVDDSIVVSENVDRYRRQGKSLKESVLLGTSEVASAVSAASLSLLAVFLPISALPGVIGQFFREFGLGLAGAVFTSWLEALLFLTVRLAYFPDPLPPTWAELPLRLGALPQDLRWGLRAWRRPLGLLGLLLFALLFGLTLGPRGPLGVLVYPLALGLGRYLLGVVWGIFGALAGSLFHLTERGFSRLQQGYARLLDQLLSYNGWVLIGALLAFLSIFAIFAKIPFNFTPKTDTGLLTVDLSLPPGTSLTTTNRLTRRLEDYLLHQPAVRYTLTTVGTAQNAAVSNANANQAQILVRLKPKSERPSIFLLVPRYQAALKALLAKDPQAQLKVQADNGGPSGTSGLNLDLSAPSQSSLRKANQEVVDYLKSILWIHNVRSSEQETSLEEVFLPNPAALAGTGLTPQDVAQDLTIYNSGVTAAKVRQNGHEYDIVVQAAPQDRLSQGQLLSLPIYAPLLHSSLPLGSLGSFELQQAPSIINRTNEAYSAGITASLGPGAPGVFQAQNQVIQALKAKGVLNGEITLQPAGASVFLGDLASLAPLAFGLALLLNYLVIAAQFNSFRYPIYILLPVPLALVGALWLTYLLGRGLDVISTLGVVMLIGLVTKNAILLLDFAVERAKQMPLREALVEAARLRLRPILMTTLTVLIISLPLILGGGSGAEFRRGLGVIILGGLLSSTLLTLFVVPSAFFRFERRRERPQPAPEAVQA